MTVQEVVNLATAAELKQLSVKTDIPAVIGYINLGVIELYKRFNVSILAENITTSTAMSLYTLKSPRADLVIGVYDSNGKELRQQEVVGNEDYDYTVVSYNTILLTKPQTETITVMFRASPEQLTATTDDVPIPYAMLEALLNYIGYRGHGSVNGSINKENNTHYGRFEVSCNRLIMEGYRTDYDTYTQAIQKKGYL